MRILWIAPNGGNYTLKDLIGTGGWVSSLETALIDFSTDVELGIVFLSSKYKETYKNNRVTYFPVYEPLETNLEKLINRWLRDVDKYENDICKKIAKCVENYNPDMVHIWGCENFYAKTIKYIKQPCVVHIQGFASSIINSYLPIGVGENDLLKLDGFFNSMLLKRGEYYNYKNFKRRVKNELEVSKYVTNWIGRTEWDKACAYCLAPNAMYYQCDELMREDFYDAKWKYHYKNKLIISSSVSNCWYKGIDVILNTAKVLKALNIDFEWNVCGVSDSSSIVHYFIQKLNVVPQNINVNLLGMLKAHEVKENLLKSDVYVHPSHIENSSNAIAEAMCLAVPVIAQYVGGNPTMLKDESGILIQTNDSYSLAYTILRMRDNDVSNLYSNNALYVSTKRHKKDVVVNNLISIYKQII